MKMAVRLGAVAPAAEYMMCRSTGALPAVSVCVVNARAWARSCAHTGDAGGVGEIDEN